MLPPITIGDVDYASLLELIHKSLDRFKCLATGPGHADHVKSLSLHSRGDFVFILSDRHVDPKTVSAELPGRDECPERMVLMRRNRNQDAVAKRDRSRHAAFSLAERP